MIGSCLGPRMVTFSKPNNCGIVNLQEIFVTGGTGRGGSRAAPTFVHFMLRQQIIWMRIRIVRVPVKALASRASRIRRAGLLISQPVPVMGSVSDGFQLRLSPDAMV